jgi:small subunit ribosomal protein S21
MRRKTTARAGSTRFSLDTKRRFCYQPPDFVADAAAEGTKAWPGAVFEQPLRQEQSVQVLVRDNNVDQALRALKKKMQREGIFREMKMRGHYEKPSERRAREKAEAVRRARKLARKRAQREGILGGGRVAAR